MRNLARPSIRKLICPDEICWEYDGSVADGRPEHPSGEIDRCHVLSSSLSENSFSRSRFTMVTECFALGARAVDILGLGRGFAILSGAWWIRRTSIVPSHPGSDGLRSTSSGMSYFGKHAEGRVHG
jgi:hypothetical protein